MTLECQLSKPDLKVTWLKDGKEITPNEQVQIITDGTWQRLTLPCTMLDDEAEYTVQFDDQTTKATLWVEGRSHETFQFKSSLSSSSHPVSVQESHNGL